MAMLSSYLRVTAMTTVRMRRRRRRRRGMQLTTLCPVVTTFMSSDVSNTQKMDITHR